MNIKTIYLCERKVCDMYGLPISLLKVAQSQNPFSIEVNNH